MKLEVQSCKFLKKLDLNDIKGMYCSSLPGSVCTTMLLSEELCRSDREQSIANRIEVAIWRHRYLIDKISRSERISHAGSYGCYG